MKKYLLFLLFSFSISSAVFSQTCTNCGFGTNTPISKLHVKGCGVDSLTSSLRVTDSSSNVVLFVRDDKRVGVNTIYPKSVLDITSTTSGILIPRMTQAQRNSISSPATSLLIYQTDNTPGYYYYDGSAWLGVSANAGILPLANGGTNANLTASNGGIFYSTATAGAILSGTATGGQMLRSGASAAPTWSAMTFPNTITSGYIPYATGANQLGSSADLTFNGTLFNVGAGGAGATNAYSTFNAGASGLTGLYLQQNTVTKGIFAMSNGASAIINGSVLGDLGIRNSQRMMFSADGGVTAHMTISGAGVVSLGTLQYPSTITSGGAIPYGSGTTVLTHSSDLTYNGSGLFTVTKAQNALTYARVYNATSGTAAESRIETVTNGLLGLSMRAVSPLYTTSGISVASASVLTSDQLAGFNLGTTSNTQLSFWTNNTERARFLSTGEFLVGATAKIGSESFLVRKDQNGVTQIISHNATSGTVAQAQVCVTNSPTLATYMVMASYSAGYSTSGIGIANTGALVSNHTGGMNVGTNAATPLAFWTNSVKRMEISTVGNVSIGGVATRATTVGTNAIQIFNGTAPAGTLSNGVSLYSESGVLKTIDAAGTTKFVTTTAAAIPATTDLSDVITWTDYSGSSTVVGWSSFSDKIIRYAKIGKVLFVMYRLNGYSNSTTSSFTIPNTSINVTNGYVCAATGQAYHNGAYTSQTGLAQVSPNTSTVLLYPDQTCLVNWTASGAKSITGTITIPIQ